MIARDERDDLDLLRIEAAQVAVLDQVVRVPVVALVADVDADVVQQRAVLEPLALAVGQPVHAARLVEDVQRQPRDLLRVLRPVAAALAELDDAAAPDVGVALDLADAGAVAVDVVEDEAFAQREVAERELVGAEPADDRVEEHRAGDREIGAPRIHARRRQALLDVRFDAGACAGGAALLALTRRLRTSSGGSPSSVAVEAIRPRLRIVPDVPMTRSKPLPTI